ncbi:HotDog domain-containing protein [Dissophora ornata]|nr:HotDog domain-containing protein [Dissophora ornata]
MAALNHCKKVWTTFLSAGGFDMQALSGLKLVSASKGSILCELQVEKQHLNHQGGCHGGLLSTIVDVGGSLAIAAEDMHATGVSTDLNISFISGAKIGDKLSINSRCDKIGGTLAYTSVEINVGDKVVALGRHTKFVRLAHKQNAKRNQDAAAE